MFLGDIDPSQGVEHAQCIANKISSTSKTATTSSVPSYKIYCSPFLRCVHTASIIATKLKQTINVEEGLYEWLASSLLIERSNNVRTYPQSISELKSKFPETVNEKFKSLNPYHIDESNDKFSFPEDESQLLSRCNDTLKLILNDDDNDNIDHIIIVAHAPCVQSIAFALEEGVEDVKDSKLSKWPLGGITRFSREIDDVDGKWNMDFYGITDHMPGDYKNGAGLWSLSCFDK